MANGSEGSTPALGDTQARKRPIWYARLDRN
jgi:hypothetical protein